MKRVLMIAYHFPPIGISSGLQRTLKFAIYLRDHGWHPTVLTVQPRAYERTSPDQLDEIPADVRVIRAFGLDTARHLAVARRYPRLLARPDRVASWIPGAVWAGWRAVRRERFDAIWSTYPIASAHVIASRLHRLTGLPWIADFRDSMTEPDYPRDPIAWRDYRRIERAAVAGASRVVFTTPGACRMYAGRYPDIPDARWQVIPNGYDEENFRQAAQTVPQRAPDDPLRLVHAGVLYPNERDPRAFFRALARLRERGVISPERVRVVLRATGHDARYAPMLSELGIDDLVELAEPRPYGETLAEMLAADGLLLFQAASCNHQIPAKLYEYLRAQRPILALTDQEGDTAATLLECGIDSIVPLDDAGAIEQGLARFIRAIREGSAPVADPADAARYSRAAGAARLADILDAALAG